MSRYRQTFSDLLNEVRLVEQMKTIKLRNGAKVLDKVFSNRTQADNAAKSLMTQHKGVEADAYQSPFNNRFYVRIKEETIKEQDDQDHEVSMARGELEAIADKATQLASSLQGKSDEGNPLEAWVQSKITKAKDYINSVSDYMMYNPDMKQNEETELEEKFALYALKDFMDTKAPGGKRKKGDRVSGSMTYTQAISKAKQMNVGSSVGGDKRVEVKPMKEELEEGFTSSLKQKAKEIAKKMANNITGATKEIEKLAKGLSDDPEVYKVLKYYNEELKEADNYPTKDMNDKKHAAYRDPKKGEKKIVDPEPKIDEGRMSEIDAMRKKGASADKIAKELKLDVNTVKAILGESNEDLYLDLLNEFSDAQISQLKKAYDPLKGRRISGDQAQKLMSIMTKIDYNVNVLKKLVKADIPFVSDLAVARLISKHKFTADKLKPLKAGYMSEGTMIGGLMKYSGQSSSEYMKAKAAYKQFMSKPQPAKGAEDKVMPFVFDDQLLDDLYVASKKNVSDVRPMVKKRLSQLGFKESVHEGAKLVFETIKAVKNKAEKTGMPYSILKQVYDRGMAAWKGGHRPGATQQQWALARVNSFVTKSSGTWGGADKDLAAKVKGSKK
jgi:hypothetical protein